MARVIRGGGGSAIVPGEVIDARDSARRIVAEAESEGQRIVSEARAAADGLRQAAAERGRAEAEASAASLVIEAAAARDGALASAEREVTQLALAAAKHIVGQELTLAPDQAIHIVREVLTRARRAETVAIRVHPEDRDRLAQAYPGVEIIPDSAISRGGCIIKTDLGQLDARLEVRLEALKKKLGA